MPFLILGEQRFALRVGETRIGGSGEGALPFPELANYPTTATLVLMRDGAASLCPSRDRSARVRVDGALADQPVMLSHGATIDVAGLRLVFGELHELRTTTQFASVRDRHGDPQPALAAEELPCEPTASSGGKLVVHGARGAVTIPESGLVLGRAPDSDLVILGREVSRRHAVIRPSLRGYVLRDVSTNGTYVNGRRVNGTCILGMGDAIRVGTQQLRFEADRVTSSSAAECPTRTVPPPSETTQSSVPEPPTRPRRTAPPFATLDVANGGALTGARFSIEQLVVGVGRAPDNEVHIDNASVSRSHAVLEWRVSGWVVIDYGSANGTFVNGERVAGELGIPDVAELRFGSVSTIFRSATDGSDPAAATHESFGTHRLT